MFRLLPDDKYLGWTPYAWLIYLPTFWLDLALRHASIGHWLLTALGTIVFLAAYFRAYWVSCEERLPIILLIAALGAAFMPFGGGAVVFFVYASAFAGQMDSSRQGARLIGALTVVGTAIAFAAGVGSFAWLTALVVTPLVGAVNLHFNGVARTNKRLIRAQGEIERLATVAERERIARDLHDVLGHTLSVIILKSELASKLADRDPQRAAAEIREVEQISRAALAEVRDAIRGYRARFSSELERAQAVLQAAQIQVDVDAPHVALDQAQEEALALTLREAVTNVIRHSRATTCRIQLRAENGACVLSVTDNGRGGGAEGSGLRGMRERIEMLHGRVWRRADVGTALTVTLPT